MVTMKRLLDPITGRAGRRGAALVEYGLLAGLVAVAAIASVSQSGTAVSQAFTRIAEDVRQARLRATAERIIPLPDGAAFPAQECFIGTPGMETLTSPGGEADTIDCLDGAGGADDFDLAGGPPRAIAVVLSSDPETIALPAGAHWLIAGQPVSGRSNVDVAAATGASLDMSQFALSEIDITSIGDDLDILVGGTGTGVRLVDLFPARGVVRVYLEDVTLSLDALVEEGLDRQETPGNDNISGTPLADTIEPGPGDDRVDPGDGDDLIVFAGGDLEIDENDGIDRLDLTAAGSGAFGHVVSGDDVIITTPGGDIIELDDQNEPVTAVRARPVEEIVMPGGTVVSGNDILVGSNF